MLLSLVLSLGVVIGYTRAQAIHNYVVRTQYVLTNTEQPKAKADVNFGHFWEIWQIIESEYLDPEAIDQQAMVDGAIKGMTASLDDPYTMYLPPQLQQRSVEDLQGSFYGVGIQLGYIEGTLAVVTPLKGNPAELAGVKAGDLILRVKDQAKNFDESTDGWSLAEAVDNIRGQKGSKVTLTLFRPDSELLEPFDVEIPRGEIVVNSAEVEFVEHQGVKAAHIELSRFGDRTQEEWEDVVQKITAEPEVKVVLLDMRNNPGGFFERSIEIASDFISKGVIVTQQGKTVKKDYRSTGTARLAKYPVMVLVNRGSASASEIVAGALRDQLEAQLVGENTFGKGTVQDARQFNDGSGLHVTIARWLLPNGGWIHEEGLPVDVEAEDDPETENDEVVLKAIEAFESR